MRLFAIPVCDYCKATARYGKETDTWRYEDILAFCIGLTASEKLFRVARTLRGERWVTNLYETRNFPVRQETC